MWQKSYNNLKMVGPPAAQTTEEEDELIIAASNLFDEEWYLRTNPDVAQSGIAPLRHYIVYGARENREPFRGFHTARYIENVQLRIPVQRNPLAHYVLHGSPDDLMIKGQLKEFSIKAIKDAMVRLQSLPYFNDQEYMRLNPDARSSENDPNVSPANHALAYGFVKERRVFMPTTVARIMGRKVSKTAELATVTNTVCAPSAVGVFFLSNGELFSRQIADDLVIALEQGAISVKLLDETSDIEARPPICIFVAPDEFFGSDRGLSWARDDVLRDAFLVNLEPPNSVRFERGLLYILLAHAVIDISLNMSESFAKAGIPAFHFIPSLSQTGCWLLKQDLHHSLVRILPKENRNPKVPFYSLEERKIDISFFSTLTDHREKFLARNAHFFAQYESFLYCPKQVPKAPSDDPRNIFFRLAGHVTAHSKISMNILRDLPGFCDWQTFIKVGVSAGAVIVSEPCDPHPIFKPGVHFLEESGRHILNLIEWLLRTPEGREKAIQVQSNCLAVRGSDQSLPGNLALLDFVLRHAAVLGRDS